MTNSLPPTLCWRDASGKAFFAPGADSAVPGSLDIIDQTLLPGKLERILLTDESSVFRAIRTLQVRGAPAIGCAAALGLAACAQRRNDPSPEAFLAGIVHTAEFLDSSRPTAVNLHWALARCTEKLRRADGKSVPELVQILLDEALEILAGDIRMCHDIGQNGLSLIKPGMRILTHCNAGALATGGCGTALAPVYAAHKAGYGIRVYSDETRPLLQGARLTAWELHAAGVDVTTLCDSMAAHLMRTRGIDLVIVGADRVARNGDTANKIGTFQLAVSARYFRIPFYVAIPFSTIDPALPDGSGIPIEERSPDEVAILGGVRTVPEGVKIFNPAFDVTPRELITGFITERGVLAPENLLPREKV